MDDFVIFADTRAEVQELLQMARKFLQESLGLQLKPGGVWLNRSTHGLSFLGHCIYPGLIRVRGVNLRRSLKRINGKQSAWAKGYVDEDHLTRSLLSSIGHLRVFNLHLPVA